MLQYIAAIPIGQPGIIERFYTSAAEAESFARTYDNAPFGIFDCVAELKPEARQRGRRMEHLESVRVIHTDVDVAHGDLMAANRNEVRGKLRALPPVFEVRDSGGGYHILLHLRERALAGTAELSRVAELRSQLTLTLAADRACNHNVSLLRRPGTHNYKYDGAPLCRTLRPGTPVDLDEAGTLVASLGASPWFGRGSTDPVLNPKRIVRADGERDPYALLKEMRFRGAVSIHQAQLLATKAMLFDRRPLPEVVRIVLRATKDAVLGNPECADWDWRKEERDIASMCYGLINKFPPLHARMEERERIAWRMLGQAGKTPRLVCTRNMGWVVVEKPPEERPPTPVSGINGWLRQTVSNAVVVTNAHAVHYAVRVSLDPALCAKGYFQEPLEHTAQQWKVTVRTVERARGLLVDQGCLRRIAGGGRIPRFVLAYPTLVSDIE
jgi:hypothetical protein